MATLLNSANFNGRNGTHFKLNLYYDYTQSVANNQTTITYSLYMQSLDGYSGSGATSTGYINNSSVGTFTSIGKNASLLIGTKSVTVTHNSDGTFPSTAYSALIDTPWTLGDASVSGNLTGLPTIPRASTPSLSNTNFNIGSSITLNTNRKSTSFTHTVVLTFGSYTKTYTNVGDSQVINTSQFASNMYAQIPNSKNGTGTITTTTYSGSTQIGSSSTLNFTANAVESNVNPQVTSVSWSVDSTTSSLANNTTIIKGVTTATIRVTANSRSSSTLKKIFLWYYSGTNKVVLSSNTVGGNVTSTFTINNVSVSKIYPGATDSRGYTTYITTSQIPVTFKDYVTLTADTNANIKRILQTEPNVRINSFTGNYWNDNFGTVANTLTIKWRYKETTASSYSAEYTVPSSNITISGNTYTVSNYTLTNGSTTELFNYQKAYNVQVIVRDKIYTRTVTYTITSGQPNFAIFPTATVSNEPMLISYNNTMQGLMNATEVARNATFGYTKETPDTTKYLRLFSLEMPALWKCSSVLFNVCGTQYSTQHSLCELYVYKNNQSTDISVVSFKYLAFSDNYNLGSRLVAIVTNSNKIEVYIKPVNASDSPTCSIINFNKLRNADVYGKITMDCETEVSSLPSGTQKYATGNYDIVDKADFLTESSGFTIQRFNVVRIGKHYIGTIDVIANNAFGNFNSTVFLLKHKPIVQQSNFTFCGLGTSDWNVKGIGYCYFGSDGTTIVVDHNNVGTYKCAAININYVAV